MLKRKIAGLIFAQNEQMPLDAINRHRVTASVPFGGRYRIIDFLLSSMANSGITNVSILVNEKYHSLFDHLGSGKEWNLSRKGDKGLNMLLPFSQGRAGSTNIASSEMYFGNQLRDLIYFKDYFRKSDCEYVVCGMGNIIMNITLEDVIDAHIESGKDVTFVCSDTYIGEPRYSTYISKNLSTGKYVIVMHPSEASGLESLGIFIISRACMLDMLERASVSMQRLSDADLFRDITGTMTINAFIYSGFSARINTVRDYYGMSMRLLDKAVRDELFRPDAPVYTKLRDERPAIYNKGSAVSNSLVTDGCVIRGRVENSILFRTVTVEEGAVVRNCILMSDTHVGAGADLSYVITDKKCEISAGARLCGTPVYPVVIEKNGKV